MIGSALAWTRRLRDLATRIRHNVPRSSNPEAFHEEKSELVNQALSLADEIEKQFRSAAVGGKR